MAAARTTLADGAAGRTPRHVWDYWRIIFEGRYLLAITLGTTVLVAAVGTLLAPKKYRAEALLELRLSRARVVEYDRATGGNFFQQDQRFKTEAAKIESRTLLELAIERHNLRELVPAIGEMTDPIRVLRHQVKVSRQAQTGIAKIQVTWADKKQSAEDTKQQVALIANAIGQAYIYWEEATRAEAALGRVKRLEEASAGHSADHRVDLRNQIQLLKAIDFDDADPQLEDYWALREDDEGKGQDLREELRKVKAELSSKGATLGAGHPEIKQLQRKLAGLLGQLRLEVESLQRRLQEEFDALGGSEGLESAQFVTKDEREARSAVNLKTLQAAKQQAMLSFIQEAGAVFIERAEPPTKHFAPRMSVNLLLAVILGLGFGGGVLFFREFLDTNVKSMDDMEVDLGLNVLAVVPERTDQLANVIKESYQTLKTGLFFGSNGRQDTLILVTAAAPGEGKTSTVAQLGKTLAEAGESVLVVDADLRRPALGKLLKASGRPGLSSYLAAPADADWRSYVTDAGSGLHVMPTGPLPPIPLHLLSMDRFRELMASLKEAYDWVLVDSPPAGLVSDAQVLSDIADLTLLVVRHDTTDKEVIRRCMARMDEVGGRILGAVLNGVDMGKTYNREYYYGRFFYGHEYGEQGTGQPQA